MSPLEAELERTRAEIEAVQEYCQEAKEEWLKDRDANKIWQGHWAGIEQPYCHMEKLLNLETLPDKGFTVSCFPWKIKGASAGFIRAVAMFD